jgi:two-component system CheB/CheR fusion protein
MTRLLDDLLDASRITEGKIRIEKRTCDIRDTLDDVVSVMEPKLSRRSQRLEVDCQDEPLLVHADPIRIQQVQVNLLNNASKYSPEGESIALKLAREDDHAVISVKDNGIGISEELQKQIFDPFVQSNDTLGLADGGMGIGLTLVRALVDNHQGKISVCSDGEGRGSEFVVHLPLVEDGSEEDLAGIEEKGAEEASIRRTIVLVEDNPDNRRILSTLLELEGHTVFVAEDGRSGIELIFSKQPEIALVDLGLPDFDGCEVAGRVRDKLKNEQTLLVALTGYGREQDINRTRLAGFDAHIVKPLDRKKLKQVLNGDRAAFAQDPSDQKTS